MKFKTIAPILPSLNLEETKAFYREKLGFEIVAEFDGYLLTSRDEIGLHFWICDDRKICESSGCYFYVEEIEAIYAELEAQNVIHPNGTLRRTDYGMLEFAVLDCHGNLLRIGEVLKTEEFEKGQKRVKPPS